MSATCPTHSLHLTAALHDLAQIRRFVLDSAASLGMTPESASAVALAVDEAVTNIILHGYAETGGPLEIDISAQSGMVVIRLRDEAPPFDPSATPSPDLTTPVDERTPGGLGLYLIHHVMDQIVYRRRASGGNELTLTKDFPLG